jgi:hypothetical protein
MKRNAIARVKAVPRQSRTPWEQRPHGSPDLGTGSTLASVGRAGFCPSLFADLECAEQPCQVLELT